MIHLRWRLKQKKRCIKKIEIDVMSFNQCYSPDFKPVTERPWYPSDMNRWYCTVNTPGSIALTLNRVMGIADDTPALFSMELMTSINYAKRHIGLYAYQMDALQAFVKAPMHPIEQLECLEQLRALALGMHIQMQQSLIMPGQDINTREDFARFCAMI